MADQPLATEAVLDRVRAALPGLPLDELAGRAAAIRHLGETERQAADQALRADLRALLEAARGRPDFKRSILLNLRVQAAAEGLRDDLALAETLAEPLGEALRQRFDALCPPSLALSPGRQAIVHPQVAPLIEATLWDGVRERVLPVLAEAVAARLGDGLPEVRSHFEAKAAGLGREGGWLPSSCSFDPPAGGPIPAPAFRLVMARKCKLAAEEAVLAARGRLLDLLHEMAEAAERDPVEELLRLLGG